MNLIQMTIITTMVGNKPLEEMDPLESLSPHGQQRLWNAVLVYSLKNDWMISVHFQGKKFNITVIKVYTPTSNAEEAEVEWLYEYLQNFLELTPKNLFLSL